MTLLAPPQAEFRAALARLHHRLGLDDQEEDAAKVQEGEGAGGEEEGEPARGWRGSLLRLFREAPLGRVLLATAHLCNAVAMCCIWPGMGSGTRGRSRGVNAFATSVFAAESAAQLLARGTRGYGARWSRVVEGGVTLAAVLCLLPLSGATRPGVVTLRSLCLLGAVDAPPPPFLRQLLRRDAPLRRLRGALGACFAAARPLTLLALLAVLLCALLGHACFAGAGAALDVGGASFRTMPGALLTATALLTGANDWHSVAWAAMRASADSDAALFFVASQLFGGALLLALGAATFVRAFAREEDDGAAAQQHQGARDRLLAAEIDVNPLAAAMRDRIRCTKRHVAARSVGNMRSRCDPLALRCALLARCLTRPARAASRPRGASRASSRTGTKEKRGKLVRVVWRRLRARHAGWRAERRTGRGLSPRR